MDKIKDFKIENVPHHAVIFAVTSDPDYEMERMLVAENWPEYGDFTVIYGNHCSCYGFDSTEWEAIVYTGEELKKVAGGWSRSYNGVEAVITPLILSYINNA